MAGKQISQQDREFPIIDPLKADAELAEMRSLESARQVIIRSITAETRKRRGTVMRKIHDLGEFMRHHYGLSGSHNQNQ